MTTAETAGHKDGHATGGPALEIVVQDASGARAAMAAGADRLELCCDLGMGGLTPSAGTVEMALEIVAGRPDTVHALIRSRPGGYVYGDEEVELMCRDIRTLKAQGVHGVVVGALTPGRAVDLFALERLVQAADGLHVTFHRALDACADPLGQLALLEGTGVGRVLTSGGATRTIDGLPMLASMVKDGPAGIEVMAGGGVRLADVGALVRAGVDAVHLSAKATRVDLHPAGPGGLLQEVDDTHGEMVARVRQEISRALQSAATLV